ncbi:MAG: sugar isomerase domain-containing protein [Bdellovibrionota bacterium]
MTKKTASVRAYSDLALPHLKQLIDANEAVLAGLCERLVQDVLGGKSLLVFGSGHSAIFALELYHRAGGGSFVIPLVADYLLPTAGPPVVRQLERAPESALPMLARAQPKPEEMLWICSQSGINAAVVEFAIEAKRRGLYTVAFTSRKHSSAVESRHASGKRLYEVCDAVVDLQGEVGDAAVPIGAPATDRLKAGPLSTLGAVFLGHSLLVSVLAKLEALGHPSTYTSVNTPEGESRNKSLEKSASVRDPLLR